MYLDGPTSEKEFFLSLFLDYANGKRLIISPLRVTNIMD